MPREKRSSRGISVLRADLVCESSHFRSSDRGNLEAPNGHHRAALVPRVRGPPRIRPSTRSESPARLDIAVADQLDAALARAEDSSAEQIVIDVGGLEFIDSSGLRLFVKAQRALASGGQRLRVTQPDGARQGHPSTHRLERHADLWLSRNARQHRDVWECGLPDEAIKRSAPSEGALPVFGLKPSEGVRGKRRVG
jgi:STAS domain